MNKKKLETQSYQARRTIILLSVMVLLGVFFIGNVSAFTWNESCVGYYSFDDATGTSVKENVSSIYNLTTYNSPTWVVGKLGTGLEFNDGSDQRANVTGFFPINDTAYSVNFWIKPYKVTCSGLCGIIISRTGATKGWTYIVMNDAGDDQWNYGEADNAINFPKLLNNSWTMFTLTRTNWSGNLNFTWYINGVFNGTKINNSERDVMQPVIDIMANYEVGGSGVNGMMDGVIDELGFWNRTISYSEVQELYNEGNGLAYNASSASFQILINLTSPSNNAVISTSTNAFNVSLSISGTNYSYSWTNNTYHIWFNNGTLFNTTFVSGLSTNSTTTLRNISGFVIGNYLWNSRACYGNTTASNCSWATSNNTFTMGSQVNSITYSNNTYETSLEQFIINFTLAEGAQLSLAKLNYNGTNYTISNITNVGNNYILTRTINIPLNVNPLANQTNTFYVTFTYNGGSVQTSSSYTQNSSFINLVKCGGAYTTQALNFTFYDEYSLVNINSAANKTSLFSSFKYWLGDGSIYKNYSFQNLSSTLNNYQFCISPYGQGDNFSASMDMGFYADTYREGTYYLRNAILTNVSSDILLYLIPQDYASKFFLTFNNGVDTVSFATVNVQEYFVGLGMYKTVAILLTDESGLATMWQQVDKTYRYSISQDNVFLGTADRVSICSATPCSLTIMITQPIGSAFSSYDSYFAQNVLSSITYNKTNQIVTYTFIDTTGLANYFRFEVKQSKVDGTGGTICNTFSYSSAGSMSCNLTGYEGDFVATGYISRSPEKFDKFLSFVIDADVLADLGLSGVFLVMILIITIVIGGVVISKGNPTTVLFLLGMAILGTKLIGIFPFSWTITVTLEVLIIWMMFQIKT